MVRGNRTDIGDERDFGVRNLTRATFVTKLPDTFDQMKDAARHTGVSEREKPAVGVDRQGASKLDTAALDERAALAFLAKSEILELHQRRDRKAVVDFGHVDVVGRNTRLAKGIACRDLLNGV